MDKRKILKEACVENSREAVVAEENGADRIELCSDLHVGGITPPHDMIEATVNKLRIPVMVMVRPRGGNFVYDSNELKSIKESIDFCKNLNVKGVVFGFLTHDDQVDIELTQELTSFASPLEVTFHKAIDASPDPVAAVRNLCRIPGISRVLTSGGCSTAMEGSKTINHMIEAAGSEIEIIAAGKITNKNIREIIQVISAKEFHGRKIVGDLSK